MTKCSNVPQPVSVIHLFAIFCRWLAVNYKFSQGHATVQLTKWNIFFCSKAPNGNISYSSTVRPVVYIKQFPVHRKVNTGKLDGHSKCVCTEDQLYWRLWTQAAASMSTSLWKILYHLNQLIFTILINSCQTSGLSKVGAIEYNIMHFPVLIKTVVSSAASAYSVAQWTKLWPTAGSLVQS